jgi:hypothetical protein
MRGSKSNVYSNSREESQDEQFSDESPTNWLFASSVPSILNFALLLLQFGIAFYTSPVEASTGLRWSMVNYCIVHSCVITALYGLSVQDCDNMSCSITLLLTEIIITAAMLR